MTLETADIAAIINATKSSGGIPVSVNLMATTEWTQYTILLLVSLISCMFLFVYMWDGSIKPALGRIYLKYIMWKVKKITGRNAIIIKHTVSGLFFSSMIDAKTLNDLENAIRSLNGKPFDLILHTPGGYIFYAQLLSKALRGYNEEVRALVPFYAMSGGTLLALSCDKIMMGDYACLGMVDPQLGGILSYGSARSWKEVLRKKGRRANDTSIQHAFEGEQYTKTLHDEIKQILSDKIQDPERLEQAAEFLTNGQLEHAYQLNIDRLSDIGIQVTPMDTNLQNLLSKLICNDWIEGVLWS